MNVEERRELLASLERGKQALIDSLTGLSREAAQRVPTPGCWTILEVVEHVAISEDYLFGQIQHATPVDQPIVNALRETMIPIIGADRSRRIECPADGLPAGRFPTLDAALEHFLSSRTRTVEFIESTQDDLRARITTHPILGPANCYEILLTMAVHPLRHAQQIVETRTALA